MGFENQKPAKIIIKLNIRIQKNLLPNSFLKKMNNIMPNDKIIVLCKKLCEKKSEINMSKLLKQKTN